jgi:hypothetical protein
MIANKVYINGVKYKWIDPFAKTAEWEAIESFANTNAYALPTNVDSFDQLIQDLKSAGIWQKLDVLYVFAGDGSNGFKLINWINPNAHYADAYGGLTWTDDGILGNGSNGYIDTNYNSYSQGVNFTNISASIFAVNNNYVSGTQFLASSISSGSLILTEGTSNNRLNSSYGTSVNFSVNGFKGLSRNGTTKYTKSSAGETSYTDTPTGMLNANTTLLRHTNGYSTRRLQCFGAGGYLTYSEMDDFVTIFNNFLTAIGLTPVA